MASFSRSLCSSLGIFIIFLSFSEARDHLIGGKSDARKVPSSESDSLNHWAEKTRFQVGDSLVWKFDGSKDSVLQVAKRDYVTCNTSSPIETYTDGNTKVKLDQSGPYYFISGAEGHCEKGQKVIVVVMSEKHSRFIGVSPEPSPAEVEGPAVAPTSNAANLMGSFLVAFWAGLLWDSFLFDGFLFEGLILFIYFLDGINIIYYYFFCLFSFSCIIFRSLSFSNIEIQYSRVDY